MISNIFIILERVNNVSIMELTNLLLIVVNIALLALVVVLILIVRSLKHYIFTSYQRPGIPNTQKDLTKQLKNISIANERENKMRCPNCGFELPLGDMHVICPNCGYVLKKV